MTYSALYARGCGFVLLGYRRVEQLGDAVYHFIVVDGEHYCRSEIMIALDMRGYADLVDYLGHGAFEVGLVGNIGRFFGNSAKAVDLVHKELRVEWLERKRRAERRRFALERGIGVVGHDDNVGNVLLFDLKSASQNGIFASSTAASGASDLMEFSTEFPSHLRVIAYIPAFLSAPAHAIPQSAASFPISTLI